MFVRKKKNRSGSVSVQVIDKSKAYRVVKTIGSSKNPEQIRRMFELAKLFIDHQSKQYSLFPQDQQGNAAVLDFVRNVRNSQVRTVGPELILGKLFDQIGFDAIGERLFRDIVIARLVYPTSKAKTVDYLYRYQGKTISTQSIYRFLDRLNDQYSLLAQQIAYEHSLSILKHITVVFYDMTSLYFESEDEDDLRRIGFSKDGKFQNPQIMRGLKKLRRKVHSGRLTKEHLNNRGYNKFLRLDGEVKIEIDETKIAQAARWDGLKGYLTNTDHSPELVIDTYGQLWHVEKAFRISKTDLRIRPMYHYRRRRIEAHVLIAFVAYTIYKELERLLTRDNLPISPQRAIELTKTMYEMRFELPNDPEVQHVLLKMDAEQQMLYDLLY
jgi:hypothetical protein